MKNNNILVLIIVAFIVGAAGFFGGMQYQKSQPRSFGAVGSNGYTMMGGRNGGQTGNRAVGARSRPVSGDILSVDDKSITVQLADGSSKIVIFGNSTSINKASQASKADLTKGTKVAVFGTENSDGSMTAQNIQINPILRQMMGGSQSPTGTSK